MKKKFPKIFEILVVINIIALFVNGANIVPLAERYFYVNYTFSYEKNNADVVITEGALVGTPTLPELEKQFWGTISLYGNDSWVCFKIEYQDVELYGNLKYSFALTMMKQAGIADIDVRVLVVYEYPDPEVGNVTLIDKTVSSSGDIQIPLMQYNITTAKSFVVSINISVDTMYSYEVGGMVLSGAEYQISIVSTLYYTRPQDLSTSLQEIGKKYNAWMVFVLLALVLGMYISAIVDKPILTLMFFMISFMLFVALIISLGFDLWNWAGKNPVSQAFYQIADYFYSVDIAGWKPLKPIADFVKSIGDAFRIVFFIVFFFLALVSYGIIFMGFSIIIYKVLMAKIAEKVSS